MVNLLPMPRSITQKDGICDGSSLFLGTVSGNLPAFITKALDALCAENGTTPLHVTCGAEDSSERYTLTVTERAVTIAADGYKGVFYAVQTFKQLLANGPSVPCLMIEDKPDFAYRGFYHDVSRGRIPTVATVKCLIDRLSALKYNSLQLYVEHTHRFAEYVGINDDLGYYTDEEIRELDRYSREHCVELVPSLSSFGHLYYLLESSRYRSLSEMPDHVPTQHNWHDRLIHHTIDPSVPESFALITSLMTQYLPLFSSDRFNICCDETFDLCKGKNAGGDVAATYVGFVSKLVRFLQERGKTVMMWGDIVMQHPETLDCMPDGIEYLNWCYDMSGNGLNAEVLEAASKPQIVCPSVHSHKRFVEKIVYSVPNIQNVLEQGFAHGAKGVLCTNWGDYGHVCADECMLYSLAFCAAKAWNVQGTSLDAFEAAVLPLVYHTDRRDVIDILHALGECDEIWFYPENYEMALWELTVQLFDRTGGVPATFERRMEVLRATDLAAKRDAAYTCATRLRVLLEEDALDPAIGEALVIAAEAIGVTFAVLDAVSKGTIPASVTDDVNAWLDNYKSLWDKRNKTGEWEQLERFFTKDIYAI